MPTKGHFINCNNQVLKINGVWLKFSGGAGVVTPSKPSPPYEQLLPLPTPCFKMFLKRSLNDPHHPTSSIFHCYPLPHPPPLPPPPKNFDHTHGRPAVSFASQFIKYLFVVMAPFMCTYVQPHPKTFSLLYNHYSFDIINIRFDNLLINIVH